jgi:DNA-binding NarL/FixJ family response regulator
MTLMASLAEDLAGEFRLQPLLEKILLNSVRLLGCQSGSICTIDDVNQLYRKEVDLGVGCQAGQVFRLDEGVTGAVIRAGHFVVFDAYSDVPGGHLQRNDERFGSPVIGVPITVSEGMIGAFVVFGEPGGHAFTDEDAELLELFATHASVAIVNSRLYSADLDRAIAEALGASARGSSALGSSALGSSAGGASPAGASAEGTAHDTPVGQAAFTPGTAPGIPLTAREKEVRNLVVKGLPDKLIAAQLAISAKTVEKHVGTILRKCGVHNRTALAALARTDRYGGNPV